MCAVSEVGTAIALPAEAENKRIHKTPPTDAIHVQYTAGREVKYSSRIEHTKRRQQRRKNGFVYTARTNRARSEITCLMCTTWRECPPCSAPPCRQSSPPAFRSCSAARATAPPSRNGQRTEQTFL